MRQERNNIFFGIDWLLVLFFLLLVGFGWVNIYAASHSDESIQVFDFSSKYGKQLLWILLSIPLIILILFINAKFFQQFSSIFFILSLVTLIGLFIFGTEINICRTHDEFESYIVHKNLFDLFNNYPNEIIENFNKTSEISEIDIKTVMLTFS